MNFPPSTLEVSFPGSSGAPFFSSGSGLSTGAVFALVGLFLGVILVIAIILAFVRQAGIADLRKNGKRVMATVDAIERKTRSTVSGTGAAAMTNTRHYYIVRVIWTERETGTRYRFSSDELSNRPACAVGDEVAVLIDPSNITRNHVEI